MTDILNPKFRYRPSFETDIRKTFERIRREKRLAQERAEAEAKAKAEATINLEERRRGKSTKR